MASTCACATSAMARFAMLSSVVEAMRELKKLIPSGAIRRKRVSVIVCTATTTSPMRFRHVSWSISHLRRL
jgi:hypothetical protein